MIGFAAEIPKPRVRDRCGMALAAGSLLVDMFPIALCVVPLLLFEDMSELLLEGAAGTRLCLPRENQEDAGILEVLAEVEVMDVLRDNPDDVAPSLLASSAGFLAARDP